MLDDVSTCAAPKTCLYTLVTQHAVRTGRQSVSSDREQSSALLACDLLLTDVASKGRCIVPENLTVQCTSHNRLETQSFSINTHRTDGSQHVAFRTTCCCEGERKLAIAQHVGLCRSVATRAQPSLMICCFAAGPDREHSGDHPRHCSYDWRKDQRRLSGPQKRALFALLLRTACPPLPNSFGCMDHHGKAI